MAAKIPHERKEEFKKAVAAHLVQHGSKKWGALFEQFPEISSSEAHRLIREVKGNPLVNDMPTARDRLLTSVKKFAISDAGKEAERLNPKYRDGIVDNLPAAPPPAFVAKNGDKGLREIDFVGEIQSLYADAKLMRAHAMKKVVDPATGEETEEIDNTQVFDRSILRRTDILETAIRAVEQVWDLRMMQNFYELIIEEIGLESPACQRRIMERLQLLNERHGMTLGRTRL